MVKLEEGDRNTFTNCRVMTAAEAAEVDTERVKYIVGRKVRDFLRGVGMGLVIIATCLSTSVLANHVLGTLVVPFTDNEFLLLVLITLSTWGLILSHIERR